MRRGVDEALAGAVRGDEVLEGQQALTEVGLDGQVDRVAGHVGHEASHTGKLAQLRLRASGTGVGHHVDGVVVGEALEHGLAELFGAVGPGIDDLDVALRLGQEAVLVVLVDLVDVGLGLGEHLGLAVGDDGVPHRHGQAGARGEVEAGVLDGVQNRLDLGQRVAVGALVDELAHVLLHHLVVDEGEVGRQALAVEDDATRGGLEARRLVRDIVVDGLAALLEDSEDLAAVLLGVGVGSAHAHEHLGLDVDHAAGVIGGHGVLEAREHVALALEALFGGGQEVHAEDHVLRRYGEHLA